ncbi:putative CDC16 cell division cycle 16-like protein [Operophtera brumata]|uniref:Putative CDC16 cell division cycle 16-like protein n=1 Tax=Operophtera brumata TaxID=104452 RepID=A0A0L7KTV0_OPEBR|nr:putative CDC16 cell division cycle 16-like protein [Operophtera brumata]
MWFQRALAGVLVWQARALSTLERREAAAKALSEALRADCAFDHSIPTKLHHMEPSLAGPNQLK